VIGYVQSGKTLSFTTVTALARDNGYRLIIVVAGTKTNLLGQSTERLENDLRLSTRNDRVWRTYLNPTDTIDISALQSTFDTWDRSSNPDRRKTVLITVMKHHMHLDNLAAVLQRLDLSRVPALIIDDEADQAGLNNRVRQNAESTTYQTLTGLRRVVPHHTYLAYTATPQALLLISRIDTLCPEFAQVLTPGDDYTGGRAFFGSDLDLVRTIPAADVPTRTNILLEPPASLLSAMRLYFLGVAAGFIRDRGFGNRTMMVHPSTARNDHALYARWIQEIKREWREILSRPENDPDRADLVEEFQPEYDDLAATVGDLPSFSALIAELAEAIAEAEVVELNTRSSQRIPEVNWGNSYAKIVVGGNAMDRGFTVEGLTVSYMPRSVGGGNVDTLQQRARFFGYKRQYLGYCRIFLDARARAAFQAYVEHEEHMRNAVIRHSQTGLPLSEWRRQFFLDPALQPTRASVLSLPIMRGAVTGWYFPKVPHDTPEAIETNQEVTSDFISRHEDLFHESEGDPRRTDAQKHQVIEGFSLREAYENLLVPLHFTAPTDTPYLGFLLQVERYLTTHSDALVDIYDMSSPEERFRALTGSGEIENPFQGANASTGYPGAREIRSGQRLTIQLYRFDLGGSRANPQHRNVPLVAVHVPRDLFAGWVVERRRGR
jgi:hypothetical protein